jgi:hypothetical protein
MFSIISGCNGVGVGVGVRMLVEVGIGVAVGVEVGVSVAAKVGVGVLELVAAATNRITSRVWVGSGGLVGINSTTDLLPQADKMSSPKIKSNHLMRG